MKKKISISIDEEKVSLIESIVAQGKFRNKSHIFEYALDSMLKEDKDAAR